jgi:virulence-associated protein VapD|tara:strand:- start:318 stop:530 length:213 start_codon:yes stop_codon:yes gene_type:complete
VGYVIIPHNNNERINMYHVLQKIGKEDFFCVDKLRKPIATFDEAVAKVKALKVLDDDNTTYIITQKVDND